MSILTEATATVAAACIAAGTSILTLVLQFQVSRRAEFRASHRVVLQPYLEDLGKCLHETLATVKVYLHRAKDGQSTAKWQEQAKSARDRLKVLRLKVRYPLWGIDDGLRVLTRLTDWIAHGKKNPDGANRLFDSAEALRKAVDAAIHWSYRHGRPPSLWHRKSVQLRAWKFERSYKAMMTADLGEEEQVTV